MILFHTHTMKRKKRTKKDAEARFSGILTRRIDAILSNSDQFGKWMKHAHLTCVDPLASRIKYTLTNETLLLTLTYDCRNGKEGKLLRINATFAVLDGISEVVRKDETELGMVEEFFNQRQAAWIEDLE